MSGYSKRASNSSKSSAKTEIILDLPTVCKMLPLVQRIVAELMAIEQQHTQLLGEQESLDENRRNLSWPERKRRYDIQDDIDRAERGRRDLVSELEGLGITVVDAAFGRIGFPTIVNTKPAFFSWQPGEEEVNFWHFAGDSSKRRPIPASWKLDTPVASFKRK
jgi:hypothetical protein